MHTKDGPTPGMPGWSPKCLMMETLLDHWSVHDVLAGKLHRHNAAFQAFKVQVSRITTKVSVLHDDMIGTYHVKKHTERKCVKENHMKSSPPKHSSMCQFHASTTVVTQPKGKCNNWDIHCKAGTCTRLRNEQNHTTQPYFWAIAHLIDPVSLFPVCADEHMI